MARCSRYRPVIFILLALLHIIHFSAAGRAGILKFEDVDRWLLDEQAFQARASLSDSAELVASFSLPKDAEVFPQLQLADQESSEERLGSEYYKLDGLRLGTNWRFGQVAIKAGFSANHNFLSNPELKLERYDLSIQANQLELLTSIDLVGEPKAKLEALPGLEKPLKKRPEVERSLLATKFDLNYAIANSALLKAGVEFVDLDALLDDKAGLLTAARIGFNARIPSLEKTQISAGFLFSGSKEPDDFVWEKSQAKAAVEFEVPGGGKLVVDCAVDGLGISMLVGSFGLSYYFQPQAFFKLGYRQQQSPAEGGQTAAELTIRF